MESGAALEMMTMSCPRYFAPLACGANLLKSISAVAASSTRAPIYYTFALRNNIADISAKSNFYNFFKNKNLILKFFKKVKVLQHCQIYVGQH